MKSKTQETASKNSKREVDSNLSRSDRLTGTSGKTLSVPTGGPAVGAVGSPADIATARTPQIDKIIAVLSSADVTSAEQQAIVERLQRKLSTKELLRGSAKGEPFKRIFIQRLPSRAVVKYAIEATRPEHVSQCMQITFNPNQMEGDDVTAFGANSNDSAYTREFISFQRVLAEQMDAGKITETQWAYLVDKKYAEAQTKNAGQQTTCNTQNTGSNESPNYRTVCR